MVPTGKHVQQFELRHFHITGRDFFGRCWQRERIMGQPKSSLR